MKDLTPIAPLATLPFVLVINPKVQAFVASAPSVMQHIHSGAVRPLASAATKRADALKDVPTSGEAGCAANAIDAMLASGAAHVTAMPA